MNVSFPQLAGEDINDNVLVIKPPIANPTFIDYVYKWSYNPPHGYQHYHREPSAEELIQFLYGQPVSPADFFIMSSKLGGLGALPALLCGRDTHVYYLPVPGVIGLTARTYRAILYDLLYLREGAAGESPYLLSLGEREQLLAWYTEQADTVIGLGRRIGSVWVPGSPVKSGTP